MKNLSTERQKRPKSSCWNIISSAFPFLKLAWGKVHVLTPNMCLWKKHYQSLSHCSQEWFTIKMVWALLWGLSTSPWCRSRIAWEYAAQLPVSWLQQFLRFLPRFKLILSQNPKEIRSLLAFFVLHLRNYMADIKASWHITLKMAGFAHDFWMSCCFEGQNRLILATRETHTSRTKKKTINFTVQT